MYKLSVQNERGKILELTNNPKYSITSITGLNPPSATINTSTVTNFDGARFNSARVNVRNLVITLCPEAPVETNRIALYEYFKTKQWCRIFFKNGSRDVYIDGYVESMECNPFAQKQQMQISILCPQPYFIGLNDTSSTLNNVVPLFESPFSLPQEGIELSVYIVNEPITFVNTGDIRSGMLFSFAFEGDVIELTIVDSNTRESLTIEYEFHAYDLLTVNTNKGNKSIMLQRNSQTINLINYVTDASVWLQADTGANSFEIKALYGVENFKASVEWMNMFEGV